MGIYQSRSEAGARGQRRQPNQHVTNPGNHENLDTQNTIFQEYVTAGGLFLYSFAITNVMVTTNLRMYDLELRLISPIKSKLKRISYRVEFRYPQEEAVRNKALEEKAKAQANMDAKPEPINWSYSMQIGDKSENIAPTMAYDDGRFTYLRFPNNRDFPSGYLVGLDKAESLVNLHIDLYSLYLFARFGGKSDRASGSCDARALIDGHRDDSGGRRRRKRAQYGATHLDRGGLHSVDSVGWR